MEQVRLIQRLKKQYGIKRGNPHQEVNSVKMTELTLMAGVGQETAKRLVRLNALIPSLQALVSAVQLNPMEQARLIRGLKKEYGIKPGNPQFGSCETVHNNSDKMSELALMAGVTNERHTERLNQLNALIPPLQAKSDGTGAVDSAVEEDAWDQEWEKQLLPQNAGGSQSARHQRGHSQPFCQSQQTHPAAPSAGE